MITRLNSAIVVATLALTAGAAQAADYPQPQPCYDAALIASGRAPYGAIPCYTPAPVVVEEFSSWYLRGDIGFSNQKVNKLTNPTSAPPILSSNFGFDAAPTLGLGIGYYFNDWARFDVTGEYRGRANFHGHEIYATTPSPSTDEYSGSKSEWLFLLNGYVDLGTWNKVTPFVGAGVGMSRNTISSFKDQCHACGGTPGFTGVSFADERSKWNFAWALHAGLAYKVSKNFAVELSYRYLDLGKAETGSIVSYDGSQTLAGSTFDKLTSHDVRLGVRFNLDAFDSYSQQSYAPPPYQAPVYQAPVYQPPAYQPPPPVFVQPPLRSKG
ncbi:MAG: porin family protein [Pseudolabrys sp.]|nr:porin family protein [Pseudolabrys sp.]